MRTTILAAVAAFVTGGAVTGAVLSHAQPPPPPPRGPMADGPPPGGLAWDHHRGPWMGHGWQSGHDGGPVEGFRAFALIYRQKDRALSPEDVKKIAEAFLLWNGNHTWKVADAAATAEGLVGFSLTTAEGSLIAKFTMDPHTAKIARAG